LRVQWLLYDFPLAVLNPEGKTGLNAQVSVLSFSKHWHMTSHNHTTTVPSSNSLEKGHNSRASVSYHLVTQGIG
jgi:hypothetical protein